MIVTMRMLYWIKSDQVTYSITITPFPGAWIRPARRPKEMATADSPKDGEPPTVFRYALRVPVYHICRGLSNLQNVKKALDISVQMAYNKREESIPVDGLLPLFELKRFNRHSLQLGAVISFSCHGDCRYYSYDDSKCTRSKLPDSAEIRRVPAGHQTWQTDPSYRSPPICYNDSGSKNQKQAAYRFQVCPQSFSIPHLSRLVKSAEC